MSTILAIETSSDIASVALLHGSQLISRSTDGVLNHSQAILPMVQALLQQAGLALSDCAAIAFGCGPGSFTGVRTACGVVQGLAFGVALPVIPVVTLLALAEQQYADHGCDQVLTALDARMGEVYWAQYARDPASGVWQVVVAPTLGAPATVSRVAADGLVLAGNGFAAYPAQFMLDAALLAQVYPGLPQAAAVARLARIELLAGRTLTAGQAQPLYLRNKIALTTAERQALVK